MFTQQPAKLNCSTDDVTEMPRVFSMSIQSDTACLELALPLTDPAVWMLPLYSSSFSVSVVLPASGCEMIANVRREEIWSAKLGMSVLSIAGRAACGSCTGRGRPGMHNFSILASARARARIRMNSIRYG